ncbi:MAG: hypothetical protein EAZ62_10110, partial [Sphingobacteriia bacterium]
MRAGLQQVVLYGDTETEQFLVEKNQVETSGQTQHHVDGQIQPKKSNTEVVNVLGRMVEQEPFLTVEITRNYANLSTAPWTIATQLVGDYNLPNVLCAVAIGQYYGVPNEKIKAAIEAYAPSNSRSQLITRGTNKIVLDAYNANPSSMAAAIKNFATVHANNKVLLLGGMMELGEESLAEHQQLVALLQQYSWTQVVLVGGDFGRINHPYLYCANAAEAKAWM